MAAEVELTIDLIQELYDANKFLAAYDLTKSFWSKKNDLNNFNRDELILGARLATRLGNQKFWRWLLREAKKRYPNDPKVQYYFGHVNQTRDRDFYGELLTPVMPTEDMALLGSCYAEKAMCWAMVRDWENAQLNIEAAFACNQERSWIRACEAYIDMQRDKWAIAEEKALEIWRDNFGMPFACSIICRSKALQGKFEEAAEFFLGDLEKLQSYEVLSTIARQCLENAERLYTNRNYWLQKAEIIIEKLPSYAPLADRDTQYLFNYLKLQVAFFYNNRGQLTELISSLSDPFYRKVLANSEKNPDGKTYQLDLVPIFQRHNTCLISSLASVLKTLGSEIGEDEIERELFFDGANMEKSRRWLESAGFASTMLLLDCSTIVYLLENGVPIIMSNYYDSFSHATVIFGYDDATGVLLVHDPSQSRWSRYLLKEFLESEGPTGPLGMAVTTKEKEEILRAIPQVNTLPISYKFRYWHIYEEEGAKAAGKLLDSLLAEFKELPITRFLHAIHLSQLRDFKQALAIFRKLQEEFPESREVQNYYLSCLSRCGDSQAYKEELLAIVNKEKVEGISLERTWDFVPSGIVAKYCDLTNNSIAQRQEAKKLLRRHLRYNCMSAELYHVLADIHSELGEPEQAILPYRLASTLDVGDSHYARATANCYRLLGDEPKALQFMLKRVELFPNHKQAFSVHIDAIEIFERFGYPEKAMEIFEQLCANYSDQPSVLSFCVSYYIKYGKWNLASEYVEKLRQNKVEYLSAVFELYRATGKWREALAVCEQWLQEAPNNFYVREQLIRLVSCRSGHKEGRKLIESWLEENPKHHTYQMMLYDHLKDMDRQSQAIEIIKRLIKIDPDSDWNWREYAHFLLNELETAADHERSKLLSEIESVIEEVKRTSGETPASWVVQGRFFEDKQDYEAAAELYLKAVDKDPDYSYIYDRIWICSKQLPADTADRFRDATKNIILRQVGFLNTAGQILSRIVTQKGFPEAEKTYLEWQKIRVRDPELTDAFATLLMDYGKGKEDNERALNLLLEGVKEFPWHAGLEDSLIRAYLVNSNNEEAFRQLEIYCNRFPLDSKNNSFLAKHLDESGEAEKGEKLYREILDRNPLDFSAYIRLANFLARKNRLPEAVEVLQNGVEFLPENIALREELIARLFEDKQDETAVAYAKNGTEVYPEGAHMWYIYAKAVSDSRYHQNLQECLDLYEKALELNPKHFGAAEDLIFIYCGQKRYTEALQIAEQQILIQRDKTNAKGLKAFIFSAKNENKEALKLLKNLLIESPRYEWGWNLLFRLLVQENQPKQVIEILQDWPVDRLIDFPEIRAKRLSALHNAGVKKETLKKEWQDLLENFPKIVDIYLYYYDDIVDEDPDEANTVIKKIKEHAADDPFVLARSLRFEIEEEPKQALVTAMQIFANHSCDSNWPSNTAWELLKDHNLTTDILLKLEETFFSSNRLHAVAFGEFIRTTFKTFKMSMKVKRDKIFQLLQEKNWFDEMAEFFSVLIDCDQEKQVITYCEKNPEIYQNNTPVWQEYGRALKRAKDPKCRKFFSAWRQQPGIQMYSVANYLISIHESLLSSNAVNAESDFNEIEENCLYAIENLRHDHTFNIVVCELLLSYLVRNRLKEFVEYYEKFGFSIYGEDSKNYCEFSKCSYFSEILHAVYNLLVQENPAVKSKIWYKKIAKAFKAPYHFPWYYKFNRQILENVLQHTGSKWIKLRAWLITSRFFKI